ncbi:PucR family transcriptional regulator [Zhihengliuella sp.]|uniref:PucR family transcriptional regulator n=1 Tax=Zhihengliuella sp. TaxID=1954483 RepID=UPI00281133EC|nr:PucR family transcriptional regulator [Zhihengliuella sp.]
MTATLRSLLADPDLGLRPLTAPEDGGCLDTPLTWVAGSDLADPTPFLGVGNAVLTTGAQFGGTSPARFKDYAARLRDSGIVGLGFGTGVLRPDVPPELVAACRAAGLPLFEVPYRIPFLAVIRRVADSVSANRHARESWALGAQRAISFASLRADGVDASLAELARQLDRWVALHDADGRRTHLVGAGAGRAEDPLVAEPLAVEVSRLLGRGQRSGSTVVCDGDALEFQTIGRRGELRGVLVIGAGSDGGGRDDEGDDGGANDGGANDGGANGALDQAARSVVASVIALVGLALEQNRALNRSRAALRTGLMTALLAGDLALVRDIAQRMGSPLPAEPVRVLFFRAPEAGPDRLDGWLEDAIASAPGRLFGASHRDGVVLVADEAEARQALRAARRSPATHTGISDAVVYAELPSGIRQAEQARDHAELVGAPSAAISDVAENGMAGLLPELRAREVARRLLAPLSRHDDGSQLVDDLRTWLEHNGQWDPAARELGIHRHTLKARIGRAERLLSLDLSTFAGRAEVWLALQAAG